MIITRTPLRVSFAGGMTDIPEFYENNDYGVVVNATVNKYVYIIVNNFSLCFNNYNAINLLF